MKSFQNDIDYKELEDINNFLRKRIFNLERNVRGLELLLEFYKNNQGVDKGIDIYLKLIEIDSKYSENFFEFFSGIDFNLLKNIQFNQLNYIVRQFYSVYHILKNKGYFFSCLIRIVYLLDLLKSYTLLEPIKSYLK